MDVDITEDTALARRQDLANLIDDLWAHLRRSHSEKELQRVRGYLENMLHGLATPAAGPSRYLFKKLYFPGLEARPYVSSKDLGIETSREEIDAIVIECRSAFEQERGGVDHSEYVARGGRWSCVYLKKEFEWIASTACSYPKTADFLLHTRLATEALFSRLYAGSTIQPHSDGANYVTTVHIPLRPAGAEIDVASQVVAYQYGTPVCFDSSYIHSVRCPENFGDRDILLFNVWHPQLSDVETWAIQEIRRKWVLPHSFDPDFGVDG